MKYLDNYSMFNDRADRNVFTTTTMILAVQDAEFQQAQERAARRASRRAKIKSFFKRG